MLFKPLLLLFAIPFASAASPVDTGGKLPAVTGLPAKPIPRTIGLNGQKSRTLSLSELQYYGKWDPQGGCNGQSRRSSDARCSPFEAFAGLFDEEVVGVTVSRTRSTREQIFIGTGRVHNLTPSNGTFTVGCRLTQLIAFTGLRIAPIELTLFPEDSPWRGKYMFGYVNVPTEAPTFQRQWSQVDKVTLYGSLGDLMAATKGYDLELYEGGLQ